MQKPIASDRLLGVPGLMETAHRRADLRNLLAIAALWVVMVGLLSPLGDFPLNDDWTYARSVKTILDSGRFELLPWSQPTALPQAYWGALFCRLFGFSFTTLRFSTLVLGLGGVLVTYLLLRHLKARPSTALLGATTVAVNPLYFCLSNSFMTDVPLYFLAVTSLLMLVRGFQRDDPAWLVSGILVSLVAILQRQLAIVLPLGFAAAYLWSRRITPRRSAIAVGPLLVGFLLHFLLQQWLEAQGRVPFLSTRDILTAASQNFLPRLAENAVTLLVYTGLFVLPNSLARFDAWLADDSARSPRRVWLGVGGLIALSLVILWTLPRPMPFSQNVLTYFGFGPLSLRDTYILERNYPPKAAALAFAWAGVTLLAAVGASLLLDRCWRDGVAAIRGIRARGRGALGAVPVLLIATFSGYVVLIAAVTIAFFDRYLLLCIPFALIAVGENSPVGQSLRASAFPRFLAWLLVAISAAFSLVAMRDYLAWNGARWEALASLTERQGISPAVIDGGYEFNGWHMYVPTPLGEVPAGKSWWWVKDDEYVIASGPLPGYREIASYPFERWLLRERSRIAVLQRVGDAPAGTD